VGKKKLYLQKEGTRRKTKRLPYNPEAVRAKMWCATKSEEETRSNVLREDRSRKKDVGSKEKEADAGPSGKEG